MAQNYKAVKAQYPREWMEQLMLEAVLTCNYAYKVMNEMRSCMTEFQKSENEKDIRATLTPIRKHAPKVEILAETVASIVEGIDYLCQLNNRQAIDDVSYQISLIYHSLLNTEFMFNHEKLEELPEWQSQLL